MRTRDRLFFVIESLNERVVGSWNRFVLRTAALYLHSGVPLGGTMIEDLHHIANREPSDHLRSLARDAMHYAKGQKP